MGAAKKISMLIAGLLVATGLAACAVESAETDVGVVTQALDGCNEHYANYWDRYEECESPTHCWEEYVEFDELAQCNNEPCHGWHWEVHCDEDYNADNGHHICESIIEWCEDGEDFRYDCNVGGDCDCYCR